MYAAALLLGGWPLMPAGSCATGCCHWYGAYPCCTPAAGTIIGGTALQGGSTAAATGGGVVHAAAAAAGGVIHVAVAPDGGCNDACTSSDWNTALGTSLHHNLGRTWLMVCSSPTSSKGASECKLAQPMLHSAESRATQPPNAPQRRPWPPSSRVS